MRYWEQAGQTPKVRPAHQFGGSGTQHGRQLAAAWRSCRTWCTGPGPWKASASKPTVTDPVTPMSVGLAWHRERAFTPAMQAFRDYFHDAFLAPQQLSARR